MKLDWIDIVIGLSILVFASLSLAIILVPHSNLNQDKPYDKSEIYTAARDYTCSTEQMDKVKAETLFCKKETSFFSSYCYGTAIMRNCTKNDTTTNKGETNGN